MSICIKTDLFNIDKMIITNETEYSVEKDNNQYTFKKKFILYKYDFNICKTLYILTNYIDVVKCFTKYDKIKIIVSDNNLYNLFNSIQLKINDNLNENKNMELRFINNVSELILHPSKKSNLQQYTLTQIENSNEIIRYFPYIYKQQNKEQSNIHSGKFLLKFEIINNKLKCIIVNGELKYNKSHIQSEMKSTNVYKSNIMVEL